MALQRAGGGGPGAGAARSRAAGGADYADFEPCDRPERAGRGGELAGRPRSRAEGPRSGGGARQVRPAAEAARADAPDSEDHSAGRLRSEGLGGRRGGGGGGGGAAAGRPAAGTADDGAGPLLRSARQRAASALGAAGGPLGARGQPRAGPGAIQAGRGKRSVNVGDRVQPGQELLSLTQTSDLWVTANFRETQIQHMKAGQKATVHVDAISRDYNATVESFAGATGARYSLMPPENASGNYVKVVQRIPVRLRLDQGQPEMERLRPGMSVEPKVRVR
ncbi:MAG: HlyD family secretion protein [Deltaproteobacteria bacterium]|nr:MAG: HlyD family secretion protein [Deltaproteobacteria bacterium]